MRSAEISGASATGFGTGKGKAVSPKNTRTSSRNRTPRIQLSPVGVAVGITAMLSAALFVMYDTARTFDDAARSLPTVARVISSEMAELTAATQPTAVVATAAIGASLETDIAGIDADNWTAIAQRGGLAFALAGVAVLFASRRRFAAPETNEKKSYGTLAAAIPMGLACWTKEGDLIVCNDQYRERLNLASGSMTYQDAVTRLIRGGYMKLLNEDNSSRLLELHREDGSCLLIDERPLGDAGFMTMVSDVTEAKKTDFLLNAIREEQRLLARRYHEEKLKAEAASRSKTNFLAHLSHDIRTPLNHIIGFAELMRHQAYGPLGDPRYDEYVQTIKQSGEHLLTSFATILDLVELESGQKSLRRDPVGVDDLLDSVIQRYREQAARAGIVFVLGEPTGATVHADRLGLSRMVGNIVENSLRFTPAGGRVTLAGFAARDGVVIEITDTGIGMDEQRLASLSQPFALGDATFTREGIGPGLGISISRAIAELSGGKMAIDSSPALGTTVAISLPLDAMDEQLAA